MAGDWFCKMTLAFLPSHEVILVPVGHDAIRGVSDFCEDINEITRGDLVESVKGGSNGFIRGDISG